MNELSKPRQQAISTKTDASALAPYRDKVFHAFRTDAIGNTLRSDLDYYIKKETLYEKNLKTAVRVFVHDIRTHKLLKTVDISLEKTKSWQPVQISVVKKAESDRSILLLYRAYIREIFYEIDMSDANAACITHGISSQNQDPGEHSLFTDWRPGVPVYYRGKIYFINAENHISSYHPGDVSLYWYHLRSRKLHRYNAEIFKAETANNKAIFIEPERGILTAYCNVLKTLTQIRTADDAILYSGAVKLEDKALIDAFPSDDAGHVLLVFRDFTIRHYNIQTGAVQFTLDAAALGSQLLKRNSDEHLWYSVHQAAVDADKRFAAVVFSFWNGKIFFIYDIKQQAVALQCDLAEQHAFPLYCKSKMQTLGFSQESVRKTEAAFLSLYCVYPSYRHLSLSKSTQSAGRYFGYSIENGHIGFFDGNLLGLHVEKEGPPHCQAPDISEAEYDGMVLYRKQNNTDFVLYSYHIPSQKLLDTEDIGSTIDLQDKVDVTFSCPALRFSVKQKPFGGNRLAAVTRQGNIEILDDAYAIEDISIDYIARRSKDRRKLFVFSREHELVTAFVLNSDRLFHKACFSHKPGCIHLFYFKPDCMERYDIAQYANGQHEPQAVLMHDALYNDTFISSMRESPDGRYLYQVHHAYQQNEQLRIMEIETGKTVSDLVLKEHGIRATRIGIIEQENRFITLVGDDEIVYVNPFTLDILAKQYVYGNGEFLIVPCSGGKESRYFYTNAPEIVSVYEKDPAGTLRLLEKSDPRRRQYMNIYNDPKKVRGMIYHPGQFEEEQQRLQTLLRIQNNSHSQLPGSVPLNITDESEKI